MKSLTTFAAILVIGASVNVRAGEMDLVETLRPSAKRGFAPAGFHIDPKVSDNTPVEAAAYDERSRQIAREMFYLMSIVRTAPLATALR